MRVQGTPLLCGLLLAAVAMAAMLSVSLAFEVTSFPAITYACAVNGLAPADCLSGARSAGLQSLIGFTVAVALGLWRRWFSPPGTEASGAQTDARPSPSESLFVTAALALLTTHAGVLVLGRAFVSRLNESEAYGNLISLENLMLPLLLQLYVSASRENPARPAMLATMLMAMMLSPYRAMLLAVFFFALLLPLFTRAWRQWRHRDGGGWGTVARQGMLAATIGVAVVVAGVQDTQMRSPTVLAQARGLAQLPPPEPRPVKSAATAERNAPQPAAAATLPATMPLPPADLASRLGQRVVFPLVQAAIAGHLADSGAALPTLADQLLRKLRLSDAPTLEEFLFRRLYGGETHGETTSLTYGEASAFFPGPPLAWMVLAPLLLVFLWRRLRLRGLDCGTLYGLAAWRSSFSGLLPLAPALVLQSAGLWLIRSVRLDRFATAIRLLLTGTILAALAVQGLTVAAELDGRRNILFAGLQLERGCWLARPHQLSLTADQMAAAAGFPMQSVLVAHHDSAVLLAVPYGRDAATLLDVSRNAMAVASQCEGGKAPPDRIRPIGPPVVERSANPLPALVLLGLCAALVGLWRRPSMGNTP